MFNRLSFVGGWVLVLLAGTLGVQGAALDRVANTTLRMPQNPIFGGYELVHAYGPLLFSNPVSIDSPPGETNRLFIAERPGRIVVVTNLAAPSRTTYLDLTRDTARHNIESGLLGITFHPGFATNGFFFIFRTARLEKLGFHNVVARYRQSPEDPGRADPDSETIIFSIPDPSEEHNAGDLQFGPDGYLYVPMGDLGGLLGQAPNKQPVDESFFGAILRLDVDGRPENLPPNPLPGATLNYLVPADNPFIGLISYQGREIDPSKLRTEFYALGFRNPWRMTFHPQTGELLAGDVGGGLLEELNVVHPGANYGWPYYEGNHPLYPAPVPDDFEFSAPLLTYGHGVGPDQGYAVVGGVFYQGGQIEDLQGHYLFADNLTGHVWSMPYPPDGSPTVRLLTGETGLSAFGRDPANGEILVVNHETGSLRRLVFHETESANVPLSLAETGAFQDLFSLTPHPGIIPYDINVTFWSDHALKTRFFSVPNPADTIGFDPEQNWSFPAGTVWVKHFEIELTNGVPSSRRRLETRLIVKTEDEVYGVTYRWDDSQTQAMLVPSAGENETLIIHEGDTLREQVWRYPSRAECLRCHTRQAGFALGFSTAQLNRETAYGGNTAQQLLALSDAGYFHAPLTNAANLRSMAPADDLAAPIQHRVRSYLAANCAYCHQPESWSTLDAFWDGRLSTPLAATHILTNYLTPGAPELSRIFQRITRSYELMPPIATSVLNIEAGRLMHQWISGFPLPPWAREDVGTPFLEGSSTAFQNAYTISSASLGFAGDTDSVHFLHRPVSGSFQAVVRWRPDSWAGPPGQAGLMLRQATDPSAPHFTLRCAPNASPGLLHRLQPQDPAISIPGPNLAGEAWLKVCREAATATAYVSTDAVHWIQVASEAIGWEGDALVGLACASGDPARYATATFEGFRLLAADLTAPTSGSSYAVRDAVRLAVTISTGDEWVERVEFFAGTNLLGTAFAPPYEVLWTNGLAGDHEVSARLHDTFGNSFATASSAVALLAPDARAAYVGADHQTLGNWKSTMGGQGFLIAGDPSGLPPEVQVSIQGNSPWVWEESTADERALLRGSDQGRVAAAWTTNAPLSLSVDLLDGHLHRVSVYFVDWDALGRVHQVEVQDAATGTLLDNRTIRDFEAGVYLTWTLRGRIRLIVTSLGPGWPVASGVFIDDSAHAGPSVALQTPAPSQVFTAPADVRLEARVEPGPGVPQRVEFLANGIPLAEATAEPHAWLWPNPLAGEYSLVARVTDNLGATADSPPVNISVRLPPATALFVGPDRVTGGDWVRTYGAEGYLLAGQGESIPPYLRVVPPAARAFTWTEGDLESRALQRPDGQGRIAACWVDESAVTFEAEFLDGRAHLLTAYLLDWDTSLRRANVRLVDAHTGAPLDLRDAGEFHEGNYLRWQVTGAIRLTVERTTLGVNTVVSAFFFDPPDLPPRLERIEADASGTVPQVTLVWQAIPGRTYRTQYREHLTDGDWVDLPGEVVPDQTEARAMHELPSNASQGYFRVLLVR